MVIVMKIQTILKNLALTGNENIVAMGNDTPIAALSTNIHHI